MPKTVVGMFDTFGEAQNAVQDLVSYGVRREDVSLVARDEHGAIGQAHEVGGAADGAGAGAVGGSVVGGALGLLIGTGLLVIPGIGPVLAAGPLAAAVGSAAAALGATALGAGIGAAAGGLLGSLMGAGISEDEAQVYVEGVRRGGTLVSVNAADSEADDVHQILARNGAIDMDTRAAEWRSAGWDATCADAYSAGNVSLGGAAIDSRSDAFAANEDAGIPRGESFALGGRGSSADRARAGSDTVGAQAGAEGEAAGKDWQDSSKLGTVGGSLAGAATGAAVGAAGGPVGAVVGGIAGAATGAGAGAAGDVAGERAEPALGRSGEPGAYDFRDDERLADADRKVVDSSFTDVDRTGERVKGPEGFATGHSQPFDGDPAQFDEFATYREGNFRAEQGGAAGQASDADTLSEGTRRAPHYAGEDAMGGAISAMQGGSGSEQPGGFASAPDRPLSSDQRAALAGDERNAGTATSDQLKLRGPRVYDRPDRQADREAARAAHAEEAPAQGDFARGMREEPASAVEPDYARGLDDQSTAERATQSDEATGGSHHGDYARGMRHEGQALQPDYARGQRSDELYDADFIEHYQALTGAGGQPYDYYKPGYQFGYDLANDKSYSHDSWEAAERDARPRWEREARGSWEEFKQTIRYGWEKARGRA